MSSTDICGWPCPRCRAKPLSYQYWPTGDWNIRWECGSSCDDSGELLVGGQCEDHRAATQDKKPGDSPVAQAMSVMRNAFDAMAKLGVSAYIDGDLTIPVRFDELEFLPNDPEEGTDT